MITLMVNVYGENPTEAIASAHEWLPIDREIILQGRYEGFPELGGPYSGGQVWPSEHDKRNAMLQTAGKPDADRWLFWIDCDERVYRASPLIAEQLRRFQGHVAGIRFVEPLPPDPSLLPGLEDPRRSVRDVVRDNFTGRLVRHVEGLRYAGRHDNLYAGDTLISGWYLTSSLTQVVAPSVDIELAHLWWTQPTARREAKQGFYSGPIRTAETASVGRLV